VRHVGVAANQAKEDATMWYVKNVPNGERVLRVLAGVAGAGLAMTSLPGHWGWLGAAAAAGLVLSGLVGFCPACAMLGRKLPASR
jgi:hypothetical protein